tara:strand:- start:131 stop:340 length:210 start_codon:yes stop_codon:yes gene_type:complete
MKKSGLDFKTYETNLPVHKNLVIDTDKTTNVNILLNRVRLDRKKDLKKKIIFLSLLVSVISIAVIFAVI